jgi:uncharacterized protein
MLNIFKRKSWSPYWVGIAIGLLSWFTFLTAGHALGISTAFETTAGLVESRLLPVELVEENAFFQKQLKIDWGWMLVVGVFLGAFLSAKLSGDRSSNEVSAIWQSRFGKSKPVRYVGAFLGGLLMMLGARMAGGCTSGHGISGALQLAVSGWLFVAVAFSAGILTAVVLFRGKGQASV